MKTDFFTLRIKTGLALSAAIYLLVALYKFDFYIPLTWLAHVPHWNGESRLLGLLFVVSYYLITYTVAKVIYIYKESDPVGYIIGCVLCFLLCLVLIDGIYSNEYKENNNTRHHHHHCI